MHVHQAVSRSAALLLFSLLVAAPGCSKDKGTNPIVNKELSSPTLGGGATYQHVFANAGTYPYHCSFHSMMRGTVIVDASSAITAASVGIQSSTTGAFQPSPVTIKTNGTVTWTNNTGAQHTVTSD